MKPSLYLFNPEHDLALADNTPYYVAPAPVRRMGDELAVLPAWVVGSGMVAVPSVSEVEIWQQHLPLRLSVDWVERALPRYAKVYPWGWNRALVKHLTDRGVDATCMPTDMQLARRRMLSSRRLAAEVLATLQIDDVVCGRSYVCESLDDIVRAMSEQESDDGVLTGRKLLKAFWSGSGKGLKYCALPMDDGVQSWCRRMLDTQGGVTVEPIYSKVLDFAMEFIADGCGRVAFAGYSLFRTDSKGAYKENWLAPDSQIEDVLATYVDKTLLSQIRDHLQIVLAEKLGLDYAGYLGVDMMMIKSGTSPHYRLHPCVEINLRPNMGVVARCLADRWLAFGSEGVFRIDCFSRPENLQADHLLRQRTYPLRLVHGRISEGYLALTPVGQQTCCRASLEVVQRIK